MRVSAIDSARRPDRRGRRRRGRAGARRHKRASAWRGNPGGGRRGGVVTGEQRARFVGWPVPNSNCAADSADRRASRFRGAPAPRAGRPARRHRDLEQGRGLGREPLGDGGCCRHWRRRSAARISAAAVGDPRPKRRDHHRQRRAGERLRRGPRHLPHRCGRRRARGGASARSAARRAGRAARGGAGGERDVAGGSASRYALSATVVSAGRAASARA